MDEILTSRGTPFTTKAYAEKSLPEGYKAVERDGGWVGVRESMAGLDIICPQCGLCHHSTTNEYDPEKAANPAMIDLKEPWRGYGWTQLPKDPSAGYGCLECCECGAPLAPSGKLKVTT